MLETLEIMQGYIPTIATGDHSKYTQAIADARSWIVEQLLGREFMTIVEALDSKDELYILTERLLAYKAYRLAIPKIDLVETAHGFAVVNDDTLLPASHDRVNALMTSMEASVAQSTGELLNYLEDTPMHHETWAKSPAFTIMTDSFLPTMRMFRKYGTFTGNHFDFMAARPAIRSAIILQIEPRISQELTQSILKEMADNTLSDSNMRIIESIRIALGAFYDNNPKLGELSIGRVRQQLEADPDAFPAFKGSALYATITASKSDTKTQTSSIYVF